MSGTQHVAVLLEEVMELLRVEQGGRYIDGTLGGGGHTGALLERSAPDGRVMSIDRDPSAFHRVRPHLSSSGNRWNPVHGNFADMAALALKADFVPVDGILLDLGMSSDQLDDGNRGFSFQADGPLDMRMDTTQGLTAADLVNSESEQGLADLIRRYGEEKAAGRISRAIVREREREPITTTGRLAGIVERAAGGRRGPTHPATRTFQALRMAVNDEPGSLARGLEGALSLLRPGGRLAVISFHSLEDRDVKQCFREHEGRDVSLEAGGSRWEGALPRVRRVTKKPVVAGEKEVKNNPRARSAKLRVVERKDD